MHLKRYKAMVSRTVMYEIIEDSYTCLTPPPFFSSPRDVGAAQALIFIWRVRQQHSRTRKVSKVANFLFLFFAVVCWLSHPTSWLPSTFDVSHTHVHEPNHERKKTVASAFAICFNRHISLLFNLVSTCIA